MSTSPTISFIGAGNMASAIIGGMLDNGFQADRVWASSPDDDQLQALHSRFGVRVTADNHHCAQQADILILAVKPQIMAGVCRDLAPVVRNSRPLIVSIAAGLESGTLEQWLGGNLPLVRVMPNTPSLVGRGAAGLFANAAVSSDQKTRVTTIFQSLGKALWLDSEEQLHAVTALSGSGPAYFFLMLEALEAAASELGLAPETARELAIQTMAGAAEMAARSEEDPAQLKRNVMSPGGTTEKAIQAFENGGLRTLVNNACEAAFRRSQELASELSGQA